MTLPKCFERIKSSYFITFRSINMGDSGFPSTVQPGSMKSITDSKLVTFAVGQQKKTRFQKLRDEKELKKKQDEVDAAKVYDSFVASFTESDDVKTFVRGNTFQDDGDSQNGGKAGDIYRLDRRSSGKTSEMDKMMLELKVAVNAVCVFLRPYCFTNRINKTHKKPKTRNRILISTSPHPKVDAR